MERLVLLSGTANRPLAEKISENLNIPLSPMEIFKFANDNTFVKVEENIRKRDVFVIQSCSRPVNDNLMELLIVLDACKRASASSITAVMPYYAYARSEKKDQPRIPITAKLVADLVTVAGAGRVITMDLHAEAIQGFFDIPVDHLYALPVMLDFFKENNFERLTVVSPDTGGVARARAYATRLGAELAIIDKRRTGNVDKAEVLNVVGEVRDRTCLIIDDIIDTAGSITRAANVLKERGALKVCAAAVHPVFSSDGLQKVHDSVIEEVIVTDTIPLPDTGPHDKVKVVSIAGLLAETIRRIHTGESVTSLFA